MNNAKFRGYGRAEKLLEQLIPKFDNNHARKILSESMLTKSQLERFMITPDLNLFTIKNFHGESAYWTILFKQPVIQYVPECFRWITKNIPFSIHGTWLEHIPSYISNINHVAMFTLYNGMETEYGGNTDGLFKKFTHSRSTPMTFYSFNILLRENSEKQSLDPFVYDYIKNCFEICYWRLPPSMYHVDDSCINNLIYSRTSKILEILLLRKTLVKVVEIGSRNEDRNLMKRDIKCRIVKALLLCDDGKKIISQEKKIFVLKHIAEQLNEGDVINGVLAKTGTREKSDNVMIGQIGDKIKPDKIHVIVSLILSRMLQNVEESPSPTKATTTNKLESEISNLFQSNYNFFDGILQWGKDTPKKISNAMDYLSPTFLESDGIIYHLPPTLITFISTTTPKILQNKKYLLLIAKLFDTFKINSKSWIGRTIPEVNLPNNYEEIQVDYSSFINSMLDNTPVLLNQMVYSRIFSQHCDYLT